MKIGILIASMSRQAGGLLWAVRSLAGSVRDTGCDLHVFAGRDNYTVQDRSAWDNMPLSVFNTWHPYAFGYQVGLNNALANAKLDVVHMHGLWMYPSVAMIQLGKRGTPYLVSPHGMLDPWAVKNSSWKKRLAGLLYENRNLRGAACIHALCDSEYESIRAYGLRNPVAIIPNGVELFDCNTALSPPEWSASLPDDSKVLFYLGRLHPKKGLVNLLRALAIIKNRNVPSAKQWHLVIAGWEQGGHQVELELLVAELGLKDVVHFVGPQFSQDKKASFVHADAFVLPSFSEGLPMAVLEAWSYRLPVLMTYQCNLPDGYRERAAIAMKPEVNSIANAIKRLFEMSDCERNEMGKRGRKHVEKQYSWDRIAKEMLCTYKWVIEGDTPPSCVRLD